MPARSSARASGASTRSGSRSGLHLPDGKPRTRPGLQAGHQPDAGAQAQVHPHGRHDDPARRDTADDTPRRRRPGAPVPGVDKLRHDENYYLTANAPFQFTKWWTLNLNLTYIRQGSASTSTAPKTLQLLFRKQLDDLLAAREILHRPVVPVPEPHGLRQLLGKTAPFPERRDQEAFRRQVHRLVLGAQPDRAPAASVPAATGSCAWSTSNSSGTTAASRSG